MFFFRYMVNFPSAKLSYYGHVFVIDTPEKLSSPQVPLATSVYVRPLTTVQFSLIVTMDVPDFVHASISVLPYHNSSSTEIFFPKLDTVTSHEAVVPLNISFGVAEIALVCAACAGITIKTRMHSTIRIIRFRIINSPPFIVLSIIRTNKRGCFGTQYFK